MKLILLFLCFIACSFCLEMIKVSRNSRTSLPTTSSTDKYFYLTNSNYYLYSSYIYICLEDNNFGLSYNNIKYCRTDTNPSSYPDSAISSCSFTTIYYYSTQSSSSSTKYYYKIPTTSSYTYSIVYYQGSYSSGYLYVTSDYQNILSDNYYYTGLSPGAIIGIVIGSIVILVTFIIILYYCCPCCRKNKIEFIPVTQPYYAAQNSFPFPPNQNNMLLPINNPNIQLQPVSVPNEVN